MAFEEAGIVTWARQESFYEESGGLASTRMGIRRAYDEKPIWIICSQYCEISEGDIVHIKKKNGELKFFKDGSQLDGSRLSNPPFPEGYLPVVDGAYL